MSREARRADEPRCGCCDALEPMAICETCKEPVCARCFRALVPGADVVPARLTLTSESVYGCKVCIAQRHDESGGAVLGADGWLWGAPVVAGAGA